MKKFLLFIAISTIISNLSAQKSCATIAEVCAQKNNTEVLYTGTATTTFYANSGILIQDETGYLYLKNGALSEWGSSKVKTNMKITNVLGIFKSSTNSEMAHINIEFAEDVTAIKIVEKPATFEITDITLDELQKDPAKYECKPIRLTDIETFNINGTYYIGSESNKMVLCKGWDITIPARGTFEGYYGSSDGIKGFVIPSESNVSATAYTTILSLKEAFYDSESPNALTLVEPMIVNYVHKNNDNSLNVYAQQTTIIYGMPETKGILLKIESFDGNIQAGDKIKGVKGKFTHFALDNNDDIKNSSVINITADDAKNIVIESNNNKINSTLIDDLSYIIGGGVVNYESILAITPKGTISKSDDKYILKSGNKSVILEGLDLNQYVGQSFAIAGIVDAGNINPGKTSMILRKETDIIATSYTFNSIAEMKAAGEPLATGTTYSLANNVLVTNIHSWAGVDITIYGIFVQDQTGGLYIETDSNPNITIGDSINGITGSYHSHLSQKENTQFQIISSNNLSKITLEEVTMETLKSNPHKYASTVVKLTGVGHGSREVSNQGKTYTEKYLYQGKDTMIYDIWDYNLYEYNNIIGVFDFGSYQPFSIVPLSQSHIEEGKYIETNIQNNIASNNIYINNGTLFVNDANSIKLYNIKGQIVAQTNYDNLNISALQSGIYIVVSQIGDNVITNKIIK